jgi:hypothetical protein
MAITVQKTLSLTTGDGNVFQVENMSQPIRDMVVMMDEFRQQEMDANVHLTMVRGALRDIQNQILLTIQQERAELEKRAEALGLIPPAAPDVEGENDGE